MVWSTIVALFPAGCRYSLCYMHGCSFSWGFGFSLWPQWALHGMSEHSIPICGLGWLVISPAYSHRSCAIVQKTKKVNKFCLHLNIEFACASLLLVFFSISSRWLVYSLTFLFSIDLPTELFWWGRTLLCLCSNQPSLYRWHFSGQLKRCYQTKYFCSWRNW